MRFFVLVIAVLIPSWVGASDFRPVQERSEFVGLTLGKSLKAFAVTLQVTSEGAIRGRALGRRVDGEWVWRDGYFCREMTAGSTEYAEDCQVVLFDGQGTLRFIAERGAGDQVDLKLSTH
ncbi:MAG: dihydrodipicolinate reductase [Pseudomonadota bacterium]|jgi:hypothetical protein|nr:dihydrodipicolinate reductase [Pseudomonadota bacterium]MEC8795014.1 dihydrodipicolinate reductase [Pseudomonadota bacterium]